MASVNNTEIKIEKRNGEMGILAKGQSIEYVKPMNDQTRGL